MKLLLSLTNFALQEILVRLSAFNVCRFVFAQCCQQSEIFHVFCCFVRSNGGGWDDDDDDYFSWEYIKR